MPFNFKESPRPGSKAPKTGEVKPESPFRSSVFAVESDATAVVESGNVSTVFPKIAGDHLPVGTWTTVTRQVEEVLTKGKK